MTKTKEHCYYILKNKRVYKVKNVLEWAGWFGDANRRVELTDLPNGFWVSTVFLGIDHNFFTKKLHIFETMVFDINGEEQDVNRYSTWNEAVKGHKRMVNKWKKNGKEGE